MTSEILLTPIKGLPEIAPGDNLAVHILKACDDSPIQNFDVFVVSQKLVSKAERRVVPISDEQTLADIIENEAVRVVRRRGDLVITETSHGFICANGGVDTSNIDPGNAVLLPRHPDRSARRIAHALAGQTGCRVGVIIADTFGRPWRRGVVDVALGCAGIQPIIDLNGTTDRNGNTMRTTEVCVVDELAAAAELVKGKATGHGIVRVRGVPTSWFGDGTIGHDVVRPTHEDLFR